MGRSTCSTLLVPFGLVKIVGLQHEQIGVTNPWTIVYFAKLNRTISYIHLTIMGTNGQDERDAMWSNAEDKSPQQLEQLSSSFRVYVH